MKIENSVYNHLTPHYMPFWSAIKDKDKKFFREAGIMDTLELIVKSKLVFKDFPSQRLIEEIQDLRVRNGRGAIYKYKDEYVATDFSFYGDLTPHGFLKDIKCFTADGHEMEFKDWQNNNDVVVFFNNMSWTPSGSLIPKYAESLTNVEVSEDALIMWSRVKPILLASDEAQRKAILQSMKDLIDGKLVTIADDRIARMLETTGQKVLDKVELTDPQLATLIQYLSEAYDTQLSRFTMLNGGIALNDTHKRAQESVDEINSGIELANTITTQELEYAQMMCDDCNSKFGWSCSVELGHAVKHQDTMMDDMDKDEDEIKEEENEDGEVEKNSEGESDTEDKPEDESKNDNE